MADLMNIFGPIAQWNKTLRDIQAIGIDVMGTMIDHNGRIYKDVADLVYHLNKNCLDVTVSLISTDPTRAWRALLMAGVNDNVLKEGVTPKKEFYARAKESGQKVLTVDDEETQAVQADVRIDPKNALVRDYLHRHEYRRPHAPPPDPAPEIV